MSVGLFIPLLCTAPHPEGSPGAVWGHRVENHILQSSNSFKSLGNIPRDTSQQVSGVKLVSGEELVAHYHFGVTDKPSQRIFHLPWSREFLRSVPSCHLPPSTAP